MKETTTPTFILRPAGTPFFVARDGSPGQPAGLWGPTWDEFGNPLTVEASMSRQAVAVWLAVPVVLFSASAAFGETYALRGTLVTPDEVIENGVLLVQDGKIVEAGAGVAIPHGTREVDTAGFIYPGLIDLHNHITWNAFPRWSPGTLVQNRYDWQATDSYAALLSGPQKKVNNVAGCDLERFGEVKALVWGETAVTGSLRNDCIGGLARNIDYGNDFEKEPADYRIFPLELKPEEEASVRAELKDAKPVIVHLAEGVDASAARELRMANAHGFLQRGLIIIHG